MSSACNRRDFLRFQGFLLAAGLIAKSDFLHAALNLETEQFSWDSYIERPTAIPTPTGFRFPDPIKREWPKQRTPDFSRVQNHLAGVRPYRKNGFRLNSEKLPSGKLVIHNYGHGGAGMTLSWAVAELAAERLLAEIPNSKPTVAVLGSGVVGLSTAYVLLEKGFPVILYADKFHPEITSSVAGGQFSPSMVEIPNGIKLNDLLLRSWRRFAPLDETGAGVSYVPNFMESSGSGFDRFPPGTIPGGRSYPLQHLPFDGPSRKGSYAWTFLIEPPIYLPWLTAEVKKKKALFLKQKFNSKNDLEGLNQNVIVNCLGMGAKQIFRDSNLQGVRGQIVLLEPQNLGYLLSLRGGYVFSRTDSVVLGGTFESGVENATPTPAGYQKIMRTNRNFFGV